VFVEEGYHQHHPPHRPTPTPTPISSPRLASMYTFLPYLLAEDDNDEDYVSLGMMVASFILPICFVLLPAFTSYNLLEEKHENLYGIMKIFTLRPFNFFLSYYFHNSLVNFFLNSFLFLVILSLPFVVYCDPYNHLLVVVCWAFSSFGTALSTAALCSLCSKLSDARLLNVMLNTVVFIGAIQLSALLRLLEFLDVIDQDLFSFSSSFYPLLMIFPSFGFSEAITMLIMRPLLSSIYKHCLCMLGFGFVWLVLGSLLYEYLPSGFKGPNSDFTLKGSLSTGWKNLRNCANFCGEYLYVTNPDAEDIEFSPLLHDSASSDEQVVSDSNASLQINELDAEERGVGLSSDVAQEKKRIQQGKIPTDSPLVLHGLGKVHQLKNPKWFKPAKKLHALKQVYLHIEPNECLSLLGPNGAGKTTMVSVISGVDKSSYGSFSICGKPGISNRRFIGFVPQFDMVWDSLTVKDHLYFFMRLKGIKKSREKAHMQVIAKVIGLDGDPLNCQAGKLSGGQKRRLSIGIGIVVNPSILLMDEPTTGLDPDTKREIWNLIGVLKKDRGVLVTTHSMEEAESLSDRVAIMHMGELQCIGSSSSLKHSYTALYFLFLIVRFSSVESILNSIYEMFPNCVLTHDSRNDHEWESTDSMVEEEDDEQEGKEKKFVSKKIMELREKKKKREQKRRRNRKVRLQFKLNQIKIEELVAFLQAHKFSKKKRIVIHDWELKPSSLEEVFVSVAGSNFLHEDTPNTTFMEDQQNSQS